ncbi:Repressor ROX1 [Termitomyces sp. T112]|nr:Repressor ROX1 [Termitomyces sp. T112]
MPAIRLSKRRRSSLATSFTPAKAGIYGISPRPVTFAPNVTPVTFVEEEELTSPSSPEPASPTSALFPPSETPAPPPARRRAPPGKRRSMGYIPRPPNAFMLFRADFVRQKHVPGTIETNHGSLSKIIGNCWRALPLEEKKVWEVKAKHAKAEHKARYPDYRFRPVHNKNKEKKKDKMLTTPEDERRCEEVAQLLLEGKKGDELAAAVRKLDLMRTQTPPVAPVFAQRRPSSVPLPNDYYPHFNHGANVPNIPFMTISRPGSPVQRMMLGNRRASSARPVLFHRSWTLPADSMGQFQRDDSPLPDVDPSLFNPSFFGENSSFFSSFDDQHFMNALPSHHDQNSFGSLDSISPHDIPSDLSQHQIYANHSPALDGLSWLDPQLRPESHPSTAYSGSPASSDAVLPVPAAAPVVHAPQPQSAAPTVTAFEDLDIWKECDTGSFTSGPIQHQQLTVDAGLGLDFDPTRPHEVELSLTGVGFDDPAMELGCVSQEQGLDSLFQPSMFDESFAASACGYHADVTYAV